MTESVVIKAHAPAVWTVAGLYKHDGTRRFLSGGADHRVKLWEVDTSGVCLQEYAGHNDVVRDIKIVSRQTFISAANDGVIRRWNIHSGQCLSELYGHQAYVYSVSLLPGTSGEELVSCGEDASLRVWKGTSCRQVVEVPATSLWSVCCMDNQDVVIGSSDGVVRVFSADCEKIASSSVIANFESKLDEHRRKAKKSDIDVSSLPGREALSTPGHKPGQTLMINNGGVAEVHQWNAVSETWEKIGDAIGQAPESSVYQGQEYDYVFNIELDEGGPTMRKLKLPYNKDTDPYVAAMEFLQANALPETYLDQVADFIVQNAGEYQGPIDSGPADPFTGGARYVPGSGGQRGAHGHSSSTGMDPFTGGSRYRPGGSGGGMGMGPSDIGGGADPLTGGRSYRPQEFSQPQPQFSVNFTGPGAKTQSSNAFFPMGDYKVFSSPADYGEKVMGKIREFNGTVEQAKKLLEDELRRLQALCTSLTSSQGATVTLATDDLQLIQTLLHWPIDCVFPGLDILRLALLNKSGCKHFVGDEDSGKVFVGELLAFAVGSQSQPKNQLLVLRCLANIFSLESGQRLMNYERKWVLSQLELLLTLSSKNHQVALSTVLLNYCVMYHKTGQQDGVADCSKLATQVLKTSFDQQAKLRALIGLGSLVLVNKASVVSSALPDNLTALLQSHCTSDGGSQVSECAQYVLKAMK
jgi:phospholipase A-2-activating protein